MHMGMRNSQNARSRSDRAFCLCIYCSSCSERSRSCSPCYFLLICCQSHTQAKMPTRVQISAPATIKKFIPPPYLIIPYPLSSKAKGQALAIKGDAVINPKIVYIIVFIVFYFFKNFYSTFAYSIHPHTGKVINRVYSIVFKKSVTLYVMDGELFNMIQKQERGVSVDGPREVKHLPEFSFIPPELLKKDMPTVVSARAGEVGVQGFREKCAVVGVVLGGLSLVSWVVILFGILASIAGIALSLVGLKSSSSKCARTGLGLSLVGLIAALLYAFVASKGIINYNYFTSDFWG